MTSYVRFIVGALTVVSAQASAQQGATARLTPYVGYLASGSIAEGPLGSHIATRGAPIAGAQLALQLSPAIALVGNVGYSDSELQAGLPFIGGISFAHSRTLMYDGGVQLRFPAVTRPGTGVVPFIEGGVGAIRHELTTGPITTRSTNVALIAGGGIDLQLSHALGVRVMARDHMSRFDFSEAIGVSNDGRRAHNWVLGVGLTLGM